MVGWFLSLGVHFSKKTQRKWIDAAVGSLFLVLFISGGYGFLMQKSIGVFYTYSIKDPVSLNIELTCFITSFLILGAFLFYRSKIMKILTEPKGYSD